MAKQGVEKQDPFDQRSRGLNDEHLEGQANRQNDAAQKAGQPAPAPKEPPK